MTPAVNQPSAGSGRRIELDILKAVAIFEMIAMHLQEVVFSGAYNDRQFVQNTWWIVFLGNFFYLTGPFGFLFSMGCTIPFSRRNDPGSHLRRGIMLLAAWLILNALRMIPYALLAESSQGIPFAVNYRRFVFSNDVLFFAGAFFLIFGFLRKLELPFGRIFCFFAVLFTVAQFFGDFGRFLPEWSYPFLCGIIGIRRASAFPLLNWGFVVTLGIVWGNVLLRGGGESKLYAVSAGAGAVASALVLFILYLAGALNTEVLLRSIGDPLGMHHAGVISVLCALSGVALQLGVFRLLAVALPEKLRRGISCAAGKILPVYIAHWLILPWLGFIPWMRAGRAGAGKISAVTLLLYAAALLCASGFARIMDAVKKNRNR